MTEGWYSWERPVGALNITTSDYANFLRDMTLGVIGSEMFDLPVLAIDAEALRQTMNGTDDKLRTLITSGAGTVVSVGVSTAVTWGTKNPAFGSTAGAAVGPVATWAADVAYGAVNENELNIIEYYIPYGAALSNFYDMDLDPAQSYVAEPLGNNYPSWKTADYL